MSYTILKDDIICNTETGIDISDIIYYINFHDYSRLYKDVNEFHYRICKLNLFSISVQYSIINCFCKIFGILERWINYEIWYPRRSLLCWSLDSLMVILYIVIMKFFLFCASFHWSCLQLIAPYIPRSLSAYTWNGTNFAIAVFIGFNCLAIFLCIYK